MLNSCYLMIRCTILCLILVFLMTGCSKGDVSPITPNLTAGSSQTAPAGNSLLEFPKDEPYDTYTIQGESFSLSENGLEREGSAQGIDSHEVVSRIGSVNVDQSSSFVSVEFSLQNYGSTIYDARFVLDEILPSGSEPVDIDGTTLDEKPFWKFGIIPAGKTSTIRKLEIRFSSNVGQSITAHIEYKERPYVLSGNVILHTDGFNGDDIFHSPTLGEIVSNEIVAGVPEGSSISDVYDYLKDSNLMPVGFNSVLKCLELRIIDGRQPEDVVIELKFDSFLVKPDVNSIITEDYFPNDQVYNPEWNNNKRWAFERVKAVQAWDWYSDEVIDNAGVVDVNPTVLAIVDSGLIIHDDFGMDSFDQWIALTYGKNMVNTDLPPLDDRGHGTRVAGIAGAMGNNFIGIAGMAWNPVFLPVKVTDSNGRSSGYSTELGIAHVGTLARDNPGINIVINLSLGRYAETEPYWMGRAINYLDTQLNTLICASAGNDKNDKDFKNRPFDISADNHYPSAFEEAMCVGASSRLRNDGLDVEVFEEDSANWGTNWGDTVDLCAPGSLSICTTDKDSANDYYFSFGGTSAATPFVAGTAALIWSKNPVWSKAQVREQITSTTDPMSLPPEKVGKLGTGRLNVLCALKNCCSEWDWAKTWGGISRL